MEKEIGNLDTMTCGHYKLFVEFLKLAQTQKLLLEDNGVELPSKLVVEHERLAKVVSDMRKLKVEIHVQDNGQVNLLKQEIPLKSNDNIRKNGTRKNVGVPPYTCGICKKNYPTWGALRTHMSFGHVGATTHSCEFCGDGFYLKKQWKIHLQEKHSCTKPFGCPICPKRFLRRNALQFHTLLHQRLNRHLCHICGKKFKQGTQFRTHMLTHVNEKAYQCDLCHKRFNRASGLKVHTIKKHTLDFPFYCELCYQGFVNISSLRSHLKSCRSDSQMLTPQPEKKPYARRGRPKKSPTDSDENNQCKKCGKCFAYRNGLRVHQRVHTGDKPYKCNLCSRPFRQYQHLQSHLRTHTGEEPYKCEYCGKRFKLSGNYQNHIIRMHTHDYPHVCDECGKGFTERRELKKHIEKFHYHMAEHLSEVTTLTLAEMV